LWSKYTIISEHLRDAFDITDRNNTIFEAVNIRVYNKSTLILRKCSDLNFIWAKLRSKMQNWIHSILLLFCENIRRINIFGRMKDINKKLRDQTHETGDYCNCSFKYKVRISLETCANKIKAYVKQFAAGCGTHIIKGPESHYRIKKTDVSFTWIIVHFKNFNISFGYTAIDSTTANEDKWLEIEKKVIYLETENEAYIARTQIIYNGHREACKRSTKLISMVLQKILPVQTLPFSIFNLKLMVGQEPIRWENNNLHALHILNYIFHKNTRLQSVLVTLPIRGLTYLECDKGMGLIKSNNFNLLQVLRINLISFITSSSADSISLHYDYTRMTIKHNG
ncbi:hypothetical protein L9F63_003447, partial [Diploptera punctata]